MQRFQLVENSACRCVQVSFCSSLTRWVSATGERCRVAGSPVPCVGPVRVYSHTQPHTFDPLVYMHPLNTQTGELTHSSVLFLYLIWMLSEPWFCCAGLEFCLGFWQQAPGQRLQGTVFGGSRKRQTRLNQRQVGWDGSLLGACLFLCWHTGGQ